MEGRKEVRKGRQRKKEGRDRMKYFPFFFYIYHTVEMFTINHSQVVI